MLLYRVSSLSQKMEWYLLVIVYFYVTYTVKLLIMIRLVKDLSIFRIKEDYAFPFDPSTLMILCI